MYGRPEGSASPSLRAFDNSIIPTCSDRSISVSKGFSGRSQFFSLRFIEARKFLKGLRAIVPLRLHLPVVKKRGSRAAHTSVTISNSFSPRPVDFTHGHRKWNTRLRMTARLFLIVTFHARFDRFRRREKRATELNLPPAGAASRCDTPLCKLLANQTQERDRNPPRINLRRPF